MNPREDVSRFLWILGIAAAVRALAWAQLTGTPFFETPVVDASTFDLWARALASGQAFPGATDAFFKPPLYPYLLAALYRLGADAPAAVYALQTIAGILSCLLVGALGARVFGRWVGRGAGVAAALLPILPFFELQLLAESWTILLTLLALERALPAEGEASPRRLAIAGLLLGIAALGRPNLLLLVVGFAVWAAWDRDRRRPTRLVRGAVVLAAAAVAILPVTVRNMSVAHEPVLISANLGANLHAGNSDTADGISAIPVGLRWDDLQLRCRQAGHASTAASSRYLTGESLRWLGENPGRGLELFGRRLLALVSGWEPRNNIGAAWLAREHGATVLSRWWPSTWLLLPPALLGLAIARRRDGAWLLLTALGLQAVSLLPFFVNARFRLPLLPLLAIFAAAGAAETIRRYRETGTRGLVLPLAILLPAFLLVNIDWLDLGADRWHAEDAFNEALIRQKPPAGDMAAAAALLERAVAYDPGQPDAHERLGALELMRGQYGLGIVEQAVQSGDTPRAQRFAAQTEQALTKARRHHRTALRIVPRSYRSLSNLGGADLLEGRLATLLVAAAHADGDSVAAARFEARARDVYASAVSNLERAIGLEPGFQEARSNLGAARAAIAELSR